MADFITFCADFAAFMVKTYLFSTLVTLALPFLLYIWNRFVSEALRAINAMKNAFHSARL